FGKAAIPESVHSVEPGGIFERADKRLVSTAKYGNSRITKLDGEERIASRLLDVDVSRDSGDRRHLYLGSAQRHDQRHGIIGRGVGINQEAAQHPNRIECLRRGLVKESGD